MKNGLYGLVVCGGKSSRMGNDKSMISYHGEPQRYFLYKMLLQFCEKAFISCNKTQAENMDDRYAFLTDLPGFEDCGPISAILTAQKTYPDRNFLVIGCDYPFITSQELQHFLLSINNNLPAAAFYNEESSLYEPLLAWYSKESARDISRLFDDEKYSLQHFLKFSNAGRFTDFSPESIKSVDTPEEFAEASNLLRSKSIS